MSRAAEGSLTIARVRPVMAIYPANPIANMATSAMVPERAIKIDSKRLEALEKAVLATEPYDLLLESPLRAKSRNEFSHRIG
ncbi:hypothetical protein C8E99_1591 [Citricoccus muralis]|uniref:Uncharacterized protein n=1 Tax=Citricoccus muralis TaxID=169134 RepID=A0A3D9LC86_9MICC|nr:hypothetical protein C8E99_1591 [Citricoccus muralis]